MRAMVRRFRRAASDGLGACRRLTIRAPPAADAMLKMRDVVRITGLSKSTIKRWVNDAAGDFPKPVKLSPRRIGWPADQIYAWRKRIESSGSGRTH